MSVCLYVCMSVCMYVCMCVYVDGQKDKMQDRQTTTEGEVYPERAGLGCLFPPAIKGEEWIKRMCLPVHSLGAREGGERAREGEEAGIRPRRVQAKEEERGEDRGQSKKVQYVYVCIGYQVGTLLSSSPLLSRPFPLSPASSSFLLRMDGCVVEKKSTHVYLHVCTYLHSLQTRQTDRQSVSQSVSQSRVPTEQTSSSFASAVNLHVKAAGWVGRGHMLRDTPESAATGGWESESRMMSSGCIMERDVPQVAVEERAYKIPYSQAQTGTGRALSARHNSGPVCLSL
ncbi:hypothetical protein DFP73DRAFT_2656 [Morchella snyderi]|nr:hypothetical protein DFP73DRAFT_2656 [Morchella snyderi]